MTIKGKVEEKYKAVQISEKFKKQEVVIETAEQYPQFITVQFTQDKCSLLDNVNKSDTVEVSINLRGNKYQKKDGTTAYFNGIDGYKIEKKDNF